MFNAQWFERPDIFNEPAIGGLDVGQMSQSAVCNASAYSGNFGSVFHKILGAIWTDERAKQEPVWKQYLQEVSTIKKYYDDVELVEPGLWSETDEGQDIDLDDYSQGMITRYEPKKFAKRLIIPEELEEDSQYPEIYDATRLLASTCEQTQDYDAVIILNDLFTGNFILAGDALSVCNSAHVIRGGGTVSNLIGANPISMSNAAVQALLITAEKMPGTNGFVTPLKLKKIVGPSNLRWRAKEVLKSPDKDDTANRSINAIMDEATYVSVPYMSSISNFAGITDVKRGGMFVWRRKPRFKQSNQETSETKQFTGSARWTKGVSNWRYFIGSQA